MTILCGKVGCTTLWNKDIFKNTVRMCKPEYWCLRHLLCFACAGWGESDLDVE